MTRYGTPMIRAAMMKPSTPAPAVPRKIARAVTISHVPFFTPTRVNGGSGGVQSQAAALGRLEVIGHAAFQGWRRPSSSTVQKMGVSAFARLVREVRGARQVSMERHERPLARITRL